MNAKRATIPDCPEDERSNQNRFIGPQVATLSAGGTVL
jgi:hypothetical protein